MAGATQGEVWNPVAWNPLAWHAVAWHRVARIFLISGDLMMETLLRNEDALGNGAESTVLMGAPYSVRVVIEGVADLLFHRWNCEAVDAKAKAAKNSAAKKTPAKKYCIRNAAEKSIPAP